MIMTKEKEKITKSDVYYVITLCTIIVVCGLSISNHVNSYHTQEIKLSEYSVEPSIIHNLLYPDIEIVYLAPEICTATIETQVFICHDPYDKYTSLYNITQEQFNTVINDCNEGTFRNSKVCIGEYLTLNVPEISE